jgi:hypothetical protein
MMVYGILKICLFIGWKRIVHLVQVQGKLISGYTGRDIYINTHIKLRTSYVLSELIYISFIQQKQQQQQQQLVLFCSKIGWR